MGPVPYRRMTVHGRHTVRVPVPTPYVGTRSVARAMSVLGTRDRHGSDPTRRTDDEERGVYRVYLPDNRQKIHSLVRVSSVSGHPTGPTSQGTSSPDPGQPSGLRRPSPRPWSLDRLRSPGPPIRRDRFFSVKGFKTKSGTRVSRVTHGSPPGVGPSSRPVATSVTVPPPKGGRSWDDLRWRRCPIRRSLGLDVPRPTHGRDVAVGRPPVGPVARLRLVVTRGRPTRRSLGPRARGPVLARPALPFPLPRRVVHSRSERDGRRHRTDRDSRLPCMSGVGVS